MSGERSAAWYWIAEVRGRFDTVLGIIIFEVERGRASNERYETKKAKV